ncbi:hypothetical protein [Solibacillus sp. FSL H8-0538]|uniref:hypothetical protein n=1 Tax=Solibacillus sp. FSL H8-0538 TaxID=2921400 RepID=UPI0030FBDCEA
MEKTTLKIGEVIEFMEHIAPKIGDCFSPNQVQRKFRTGYINARKAINELVELGYLEVNTAGHISFRRKK